MTTILTENKKRLLNAEDIRDIHIEKRIKEYHVTALTFDSGYITLGIYKSEKNAERVITYLGYCLSTANANTCKFITVPNEATVSRADINEKIESAMNKIQGVAAAKEREGVTV